MIELYHNDMSVCARKVRFAPPEKNLNWDGHHVNFCAGDQQKPEYLKLNPNAVVPTLLDNGAVIIESAPLPRRQQPLSDSSRTVNLAGIEVTGTCGSGMRRQRQAAVGH